MFFGFTGFLGLKAFMGSGFVGLGSVVQGVTSCF